VNTSWPPTRLTLLSCGGCGRVVAGSPCLRTSGRFLDDLLDLGAIRGTDQQAVSLNEAASREQPGVISGNQFDVKACLPAGPRDELRLHPIATNVDVLEVLHVVLTLYHQRMLWFDHVIMTVRDLDGAAARLLATHGLQSAAGGRHVGLGTGNRIVPLGDSYVELMAVVDSEEAKDSLLAHWVVEQTADGDRLAAWCLRTDDIDGVASRLGLTSEPMSRRRPDGVELAWRLAGLETALSTGLPLFIQWDIRSEDHPGRALGTDGPGISWVEVGGDAKRLANWLGPNDLDVRVVDGPAGIHRVGIGEIAL